MLLLALSTSVLVRHLGTAAFGVYSFVVLANGFLGLSTAGFIPAGIHEIAASRSRQQPRTVGVVFWTVVLMTAAFAALTSTAWASMAPITAEAVIDLPHQLVKPATRALAIGGASIFFSQLGNGLLVILIGNERYVPASVSRIIGATIVNISVAGSAWLTGDLVHTMWCRAAGTVAGCVVSLLVSLPSVPRTGRIHTREVVAAARRIWRFSVPVLVTQSGGMIGTQVDRFVVAFFLPAEVIGYYAVPTMLLSQLHGLIGAAAHSMFPAISRLLAVGDRTGVKQMFVRGTRWVITGFLAVALPLAAYESDIFSVWVGPKVAYEIRGVFPILIVGFFLKASGITAYYLLYGENRPGVFARFTLLSAGTNLAVSLALVPRLGMTGAAAAFGIGSIWFPFAWLRAYGWVGGPRRHATSAKEAELGATTRILPAAAVFLATLLGGRAAMDGSSYSLAVGALVAAISAPVFVASCMTKHERIVAFGAIRRLFIPTAAP